MLRTKLVASLLAALAALPALAGEKALSLAVQGWHSKGDAYKTEVAVRAVKGVRSARADPSAKTVAVVFDDAVAKPEQLEKAVEAAGFTIAR